MLLRQIKEQDIPVLVEFEKEISLISFGKDAITDTNFHAKRLLKSFEKDPEGMLVMTNENIICGWVWLDKKINFLTQENYINFRSLYVPEEYRGSEVCDSLMEACLEYCRAVNAKQMIGKVHIDNIPMRALYKKFNFKATHITMEYEV